MMTALTRKYDHKVITGLNLPAFIDLYLKVSMDSDSDIDELVPHVIETVKESAVFTNDKLDGE
ncbi:hypothetical protein FD02_GL000078 [Lacticaseibacillus nasuensis JCM 17158]|uniref:Uncharacterized protein n=1 Tax=Lacticaseibacillus nasuensis JCM 17158 TaxID=1291734 RepID=A0A0R1JRN1_9LACO|nr:hypothetical protein FD02_GL000078 [Lacticaseibacillus nasuensis JCM 17158]